MVTGTGQTLGLEHLPLKSVKISVSFGFREGLQARPELHRQPVGEVEEPLADAHPPGVEDDHQQEAPPQEGPQPVQGLEELAPHPPRICYEMPLLGSFRTKKKTIVMQLALLLRYIHKPL